MKIRITKAGELEVDGRKKLCPFDQPMAHIPKIPCGDWCALFNVNIKTSQVIIYLCNDKDWNCSPVDFTDERKKP